MQTWHDIVRNSIRTGVLASVATALVAAERGQSETGDAFAPLNAVSHIIWGNKAARAHGASGQYTATGIALNSGAALFWAGVHELLFSRRLDRGGMGDALLSGAGVAGLAYVTDYHLVPDRLTPGFEKHLSGRSLFVIYAALALGLGLGGKLGRSPRPDPLNFLSDKLAGLDRATVTGWIKRVTL